jgi:hypothetical protein
MPPAKVDEAGTTRSAAPASEAAMMILRTFVFSSLEPMRTVALPQISRKFSWFYFRAPTKMSTWGMTWPGSRSAVLAHA